MIAVPVFPVFQCSCLLLPHCFCHLPASLPGQYHLKQISVQLDPELSALQFREAFGDGQPQSAALGITGGVSSDEPFRQFLSGYGQLLCRDIF